MPTAEVRQFRVHAHHDSGHRARVVAEPTFEAAALAYVEEWPHAIDDSSEVRIIVRDLQDGHERCFTIDLETGETGACG